MINVFIHEGTFDNQVRLYDTKMPVVPRVGETIFIRWPDRDETRCEVLAVEYIIDVRGGMTVVEETTGARIAVRILSGPFG